MKEIPNTKLLVSLNHCYSESTNLAIFDLSQHGAKKIYSFEEAFDSKIDWLKSHWYYSIFLLYIKVYPSLIILFSLAVYLGDLATNTRRNLIGAISVPEKIAYHLLNVGYSQQKGRWDVKLLRKSIYAQNGCPQSKQWVLSLENQPRCKENILRA